MASATPSRRKSTDTSKTTVTYRVHADSRTRVERLAGALGLGQNHGIDEVLTNLPTMKRTEVLRHVDEVQASLDAKLRHQSPAEVLTGSRRQPAVRRSSGRVG